jgi:hypothetical protein
MSKFYKTLPQEQETIVNISYFDEETTIYTSRKQQIERLLKELGKPEQVYYIDKAITGCSWKIPFSDKKRTAKCLSRPLLIGEIGKK